jgi:hypothetical protein
MDSKIVSQDKIILDRNTYPSELLAFTCYVRINH